MENLQTIGKENHKSLVVKIHYSEELKVLDEPKKTLLQILYVDEGAVLVGDDDEEKALIAPVLLCLNYFETQKTIHLKNAKGYSVFFEPEAINHGLIGDDEKHEKNSKDYFETEQLLIYPFKQSTKDNPVYLPVNGSVRERLLRIASDVKDQFYKQPDEYWPCRGRSFFIEMLMLLQSLYKLQIDNAIDIDTSNKSMIPVIKEIHLNYSNPDFSLKDLKTKEMLGSGIKFLKRKKEFKKVTGENPLMYLEKLRVEVGANLLKDTILKISEIARRCGFKTEEDFTDIFYKHKEMAPSSWRASFPNPYG